MKGIGIETKIFPHYNIYMFSRQKVFITLLLVLLPAVLLFSCKSTEHEEKSKSLLTLLFAGDIMAHTQNFRMQNYSLIWDDIRKTVFKADLSFANLEAPVNNDMPFESYPTFNMQYSYPEAAIEAGFNVFSLANNHTNDQGSQGIKGTAEWSRKIEKDTKGSTRPVYFSGIQENNGFSWRIIEVSSGKSKKKIRILYLAVTELLNTWANYTEINYITPNKKGRSSFIEYAKKLREENPCDLFIISIHTSEEEYILSVLDSVKTFYHQLLDAGCDIVAANHPHVIRPVEYIGDKETGRIRKMILYANGNVISAQRKSLNYSDPSEIWQYTGDGMLLTAEIEKDRYGYYISETDMDYITTYVDRNDFLVKKLNDKFIKQLNEEGKKKTAEYFSQRLKLLKEIKGIETWQ